MNLWQRVVLISALMLLFGMALFPPWRAAADTGDYAWGYHFVFRPSYSLSGHTGMRIDTARFALQFVAVLALTGAAYLILGPNRK